MSNLADFDELCADYTDWWRTGILEKADAVDCVQRHAELWNVIDEIGQDAVQAIMSAAFVPAEPMPSDYASQLLMQWELDDPRDRWRWTGEAPPPKAFRNSECEWPLRKPHETPQATLDAFIFVLSTGDPDRIASWLSNHLEDAPTFARILEAA